MIQGPEPMEGSPHDDASRHPRIFFAVDDITAAVARIRELGGTAEDPVDIPSGSFAHCTDDQGVDWGRSASRQPIGRISAPSRRTTSVGFRAVTVPSAAIDG